MSHKSTVHGGGESSDRIVPAKSANKGRGLSAEQVEGRRSAKGIPRHGPMLDTVPENTGALQCRREDVQPDLWLGALISKVGTVCVRSASTGLCGGQWVTAVPTATRAPTHRALFLLRRARIETNLDPAGTSAVA